MDLTTILPQHHNSQPKPRLKIEPEKSQLFNQQRDGRQLVATYRALATIALSSGAETSECIDTPRRRVAPEFSRLDQQLWQTCMTGNGQAAMEKIESAKQASMDCSEIFRLVEGTLKRFQWYGIKGMYHVVVYNHIFLYEIVS
ncbi:unnamed protein product [Urochloa humidicola]